MSTPPIGAGNGGGHDEQQTERERRGDKYLGAIQARVVGPIVGLEEEPYSSPPSPKMARLVNMDLNDSRHDTSDEETLCKTNHRYIEAAMAGMAEPLVYDDDDVDDARRKRKTVSPNNSARKKCRRKVRSSSSSSLNLSDDLREFDGHQDLLEATSSNFISNISRGQRMSDIIDLEAEIEAEIEVEHLGSQSDLSNTSPELRCTSPATSEELFSESVESGSAKYVDSYNCSEMLSTQLLENSGKKIKISLVKEKRVSTMAPLERQRLVVEKSFDGKGYQLSEALIFNNLGEWLEDEYAKDPFYKMTRLRTGCECVVSALQDTAGEIIDLPIHDHFLLLTKIESENPEHFNCPAHLVFDLHTRYLYLNIWSKQSTSILSYQSFKRQLRGQPELSEIQLYDRELTALKTWLHNERTRPSRPYMLLYDIQDGYDLYYLLGEISDR